MWLFPEKAASEAGSKGGSTVKPVMKWSKIRIPLPVSVLSILAAMGLVVLFYRGEIQLPPELEEGYFTQLNEGYVYEARIRPETLAFTLTRDRTGGTDTLERSGRLEKLDGSRWLLTGVQGGPTQVLTLAEDGTFYLYDGENQLCTLFFPFSAAKAG